MVKVMRQTEGGGLPVGGGGGGGLMTHSDGYVTTESIAFK
jgi:hypothetical protein